MMIWRFALLLILAPLYGCVVGQTVTFDFEPELAADRYSGAVSVTVKDERPYVLSGDKRPEFIGKYRAGFGNPWDVTTQGRKPLADLIAGDLIDELRALGFTESTEGRQLEVSIQEWNLDSYTNARFWYEVRVRVLDKDGRPLIATQTLADDRRIDGSIWTGAKGAVESEMPRLYRAVIRSMVRDNPAVANVLAGR